MNHLEDVIAKCKCGVFLSVNEHRDYYDKAEDKVRELNERGMEQKNPEKEVDDELATRIIATDTVYELQFYPDTPIGSYTVYGTTLQEVVDKAMSVFSPTS